MMASTQQVVEVPEPPAMWPLPACSRVGRLEVRWEAPPGSPGAMERRYEVWLMDLREDEPVVVRETGDCGWVTPVLPAGVYELRVRARELDVQGAAVTSDWSRRRFRVR